MRLFALLTTALLSACAAGPMPGVPAAVPVQFPAVVDATADLASISYSTTACFGSCPVFAVVVTRDGRGEWEGQRFVAALGERTFAVAPAQFAAFAAALAPHRPKGDRRLVTPAECAAYVTDADGVDVVWTDRAGRKDTLSAYFGCDREANRALFANLKGAIRALPVAALIGPAGS